MASLRPPRSYIVGAAAGAAHRRWAPSGSTRRGSVVLSRGRDRRARDRYTGDQH